MKQKEFSISAFINRRRKEYASDRLLEEDCDKDPFIQFEQWLSDAMEKDDHHGNAMTLSTIREDGMPDARIVLLRDISYGGLTFFTNYKSTKGVQIGSNSRVCLSFFWKELERQVKIQGEVRFLPTAESDRYFNQRPFESQVGAWASQQSGVIQDRKSLDDRYDNELAKYDGSAVPRPVHWGGYVVLPSAFEFWQGRKNRLHDRLRYVRQEDQSWKMERLMP